MALTIAQIQAHMTPYEGNVAHMYLDTNGYVTVGIGNLLPNVAAAQTLPFVHKADSQRAAAADIQTDFETVKAQRSRHTAAWYARRTALQLNALDIELLFQRRVNEFLRQLRGVFTNFDHFPDSAQLAVLDMAFNLGVGALNRSWPNFRAAVIAENWSDAATHCVRPGAAPARNAGTQALFRSAAAEASAPAPTPAA